MNIFTLLETFANGVVDFLENIDTIFFGTLDEAVRVILDFTRYDPLTIVVRPLYDQLFALNGIIENALGVDLLFFLDFSLGSFLLPSVITVLIIILAVVGIWRLILSLLPFA